MAAEAPALVPRGRGVNGFLTVIGTVAARILGLTFGSTLGLLLGAAAYLGFSAVIRLPSPYAASNTHGRTT